MNQAGIIDSMSGPYVGLVPYTEAQARFFFGREKDIDIISTNLRASPLTILYGASGVGKSSVIRAGVLPRLNELSEMSILPDEPPDFFPVVLRDWNSDPHSSFRAEIGKCIEERFPKWEISIVREKDVREWRKEAESTETLRDLIVFWSGRIKTKYLIILDQFEEVLRPEFFEGNGDFIDELADVINDSSIPVHFLISLRDDSLSRLDLFKGKIQGALNNTLRLNPLTREEAEKAIFRPAALWVPNFEVDKDFADEVLWRVRSGNIKLKSQGQAKTEDPTKLAAIRESGVFFIDTPYLQIVLNRVWNELESKDNIVLSLEALNNTGSSSISGDTPLDFEGSPVETIVETHLDKVFAKLPDIDQVTLSKFIHYTVPREGAKITFSARWLAGWARMDEDEEEIESIICRLCNVEPPVFRRIERIDGDRPGYTVAHDALIPSILSWRERFIKSDFVNYYLKIKKLIPWIAGLSIFVLLGFLLFLYFTKAAANEKAEFAKYVSKQNQQQDRLVFALEVLLNNKKTDKSEALAVLQELNAEGALQEDTVTLLNDFFAQNTTGTKGDDNQQPVLTKGQSAKPKVRTIVHSESQSSVASRLFALFGKRFDLSDRIQVNLSSPVTDGTQVRYFHRSDANTAQQVSQLLSNYGISDVNTYLFSSHEKSSQAGEVEIWFDPDAFNNGGRLSDNVNLRNKPNGTVITVIPAGSAINRQFCMPNFQNIDGQKGRWCQVVYNGYPPGWIFDAWLSEDDY